MAVLAGRQSRADGRAAFSHLSITRRASIRIRTSATPNEYNRCLGVLERRLEGREFIVDEYSIVDMCCWPWVLIAKPLGQALDEFPNVARWRKAVMDRPAVRRGVDLGKEWRRSAPPSDEERKILFNQTARAVLGS